MALMKYFLIYRKYLDSRIFIPVILGFFVGALEVLGAAILIPVILSMFSNGLDTNSASNLISSFLPININISSYYLVALGVSLIAAKAFFLFGLLVFDSFIRTRLAVNIRSILTLNIKDISFKDLVNLQVAKYVNLSTEQVTKSMSSFNALTQFSAQLCIAGCYTLLALNISVSFTFLITLSGLLIYVLYKKLSAATKSQSRIMVQATSEYAASIEVYLNGISYLRSVGFEENENARLKKLVNKLGKIQFKLGAYAAIAQSAREPVALLTVIGISWAHFSLFDGSIEATSIAAILLYRSVTALVATQSYWQSSMENISSIENIDLMYETMIKGSERNICWQKSSADVLLDETNKDVLRVDNISFSYPHSQTLFSDLSFTLRKGEVVWLRGHSGSGKSTLINVMLGLLAPSSGRVLLLMCGPVNFDENCSCESPSSSRRQQPRLGYVPQTPYVFDGTFIENVFLGLDAGTARKAFDRHKTLIRDLFPELEPDFAILSLMQVGPYGSALSGGQRKRVAFARELIRGPDLLILDEVTSELDESLTSTVWQLIDDNKSKTAIVIVSHDNIPTNFIDTIVEL